MSQRNKAPRLDELIEELIAVMATNRNRGTSSATMVPISMGLLWRLEDFLYDVRSATFGWWRP